ncbi:gasdermin B [Homo sapiens]|uniref:Isoform 2 of Gasdermin-B n=1 Tax=Homo sapiens TaxID=9606 RepID=Q8TAX9-2|nr:gasdermin-B isoform 2 [Homo sapiens]NP_061000.2 gasdermin-B isoform 2 [Homo sapiens]EAW60613.1 gasdermin-like, isoform CRA_b [Homo sapiens]KAI4049235.1 gasdermin B [Homo sapiens]|eukprot:NP_061000.2 gasdermin-B isoform 2 [Homo sapiens]
MFSVFEEITRIVVKEMDAGGDMIAVRSLVDADRFRCFHLVGEKRTFFGCRHYTTGLTLMDILDTDGDKWLDELDSGLQGQKAEFQILDNVDSTGELIVRLPKEITISGSFQGFHHQKIKISENRISQQYLATLENRKLKRELPFSFRSINTRENLYLVTETLETVKEETLKSDRQYKFWSQISQGHLSYKHKGQREVTIPPNRVLSYRVKQLVFPNKETMRKSLGSEDSRNMKEKLEDMESVLKDLTEEKRKDVLNSLAKCLGKEDIRQDLEQRVSEVLISGELHMEDPDKPLLSSLFNAAGVLVEARAKAILDFLDALLELSEEQQFVAEALEKGTLPLLKDQVKSVMEQNWDELASSPPDMDYDPEARILCALYVVVSILLELAEGPTSVSS